MSGESLDVPRLKRWGQRRISSSLRHQQEPPPGDTHAAHVKCALDYTQQQIRLLCLSPGAWNDPIVCSFAVASLDDTPTYYALSYVWGDDPPTHEISIDGTHIWVRPGLFRALRRLRSRFRADNLVIWIDALCIDQAHLRERNHQVGIMGIIYAKCKNVLVWLDEVGGLSENIEEENVGAKYSELEWLDYWSDLRLADERGSIRKPQNVPSSMSTEVAMQMIYIWYLLSMNNHYERFIPRSGSAWSRAYGHYFQMLVIHLEVNPWFRRLWTVQETVLAPTVTIFFSTVAISLNTIIQAKVNYWEHRRRGCCAADGLHPTMVKFLEMTFEPFLPLIALKNQLVQSPAEILDIRLDLFLRHASYDLDQVYSLVSLCETRKGLRSIVPDYTEIPETLYRKVSRDYLNWTPSLRPLSVSWIKNSHSALPSWTIDWTILSDTWENAELVHQWKSLYSLFNAGKGLGTPRRSIVINELSLSGLNLDTIISVHDYDYNIWSNPFIDDSIRLRLGHDYPGAHNTSWKEALMRTVCADSFSSTSVWLHGVRINRLHKPMIGRLLKDALPRVTFRDGGLYKFRESRILPINTGDTWLTQLTDAGALKARLFFTKNGYVGLAHKGCQMGHEIFIAAGVNMPLLLETLPAMPTKYLCLLFRTVT